jgi:hypothetical protein
LHSLQWKPDILLAEAHTLHQMGKASKVPNCKTVLHITHPLEKSITKVHLNLDLLNYNASILKSPWYDFLANWAKTRNGQGKQKKIPISSWMCNCQSCLMSVVINRHICLQKASISSSSKPWGWTFCAHMFIWRCNKWNVLHRRSQSQG